MRQRVGGGAVHYPAAVAFESPGPVVAPEVSLAARPASDHGCRPRFAEFAVEHALLERRDSGLINVLEPDENRQARAIASGDHGIDVIDTSRGWLLTHHRLARRQRRF